MAPLELLAIISCIIDELCANLTKFVGMEHIIKIKINDRSKVGKSFLAYLKSLVKRSNDVVVLKEKTTESNTEEDSLNFAALSESSLAKEWLSLEDDVWDAWLKEKEA